MSLEAGRTGEELRELGGETRYPILLETTLGAHNLSVERLWGIESLKPPTRLSLKNR